MNTKTHWILKGFDDMNSAADVWKKVLEMLGTDLTSTAISTWFDDCRAVGIDDKKLILCTESDFKKDVIEGRFMPLIKNALHEIFSGDMDVLLLGESGEENYARGAVEESPVTEEYTFERFVVGSNNRYAHAAAKAVADGNVTNYNPLFIYGDSGLGKTHLLHAIRIEMKRLHPEYNVVLAKGEEFTNELIYALQIGKNIAFREKYRGADVLLIDDIQFIAGKTATEEEFFNTFNDLYEHKRQIVLSSDRPPSEIPRLSDRLRSRFESGIMTEINPPDYETRVAIIKNKATELGLSLSDDVSSFIAENVTANVRQLEGAVKMIRARSELEDIEVNVPFVTEILRSMFSDNSGYAATPDDIIAETAKYFSLSPDDLKGQSRTKNTALARHISMYIIRTQTNFTLNDIGSLFGGRDHSTVLSSIRLVEDNIRTSPDFSKTVKDIIANVNSGK